MHVGVAKLANEQNVQIARVREARYRLRASKPVFAGRAAIDVDPPDPSTLTGVTMPSDQPPHLGPSRPTGWAEPAPLTPAHPAPAQVV